jgi:hypothetical protein
MSVLRDTLDQREGWATKQRVAVVPHSRTKTVLENCLLVAIGLVVYNHHDAVMGLIRALLQ